jgi:hypothetical protein
MIETLLGLGGFLAGAGCAWGVLRRKRAPTMVAATPVQLEIVPEPKPLAAVREIAPERELEGKAPPHLIALIGDAIREPLRQLRRSGEVPSDALQRLERIAWQMRMLVARPRPMRAAPTSPISLLQEAAEQIPLLRDGSVGASWSLLNRQPVHVDPERMLAAFRALLESGAELAGEGGRIGIKILRGESAGFPVQIEIEIGRRGTELDPLAMLVTRHLIESQGGRIEIDGNMTRVFLRNAGPDEQIASVA